MYIFTSNSRLKPLRQTANSQAGISEALQVGAAGTESLIPAY
jgi:hypothetical protein